MTQGNGFTHASGGTTVTTALDTSNGIAVTVTIDSPHHNAMAGLLGMPTWMVTTTATALAGLPDTAYGASPFIFPVVRLPDRRNAEVPDARSTSGRRTATCPTSLLDFAWTNYGTGNVDNHRGRDRSSKARPRSTRRWRSASTSGSTTTATTTTLYDPVNTYLAGLDVPAAIVDPYGNFVGWATFHVNSATGGTDKHINGYFKARSRALGCRSRGCSANDCPRYLGSYILKLTN